MSKFDWLKCSSNTCSLRLAKIDAPPVSFNCNLPELKVFRAISELKVPAGWVECIPAVGQTVTFQGLKMYRAGNDMKYTNII